MPPIANKAIRLAAAKAAVAQHSGELLLTAYDQLKPTERIFVDVYVATDQPLKAMREAMPAIADHVLKVRAVDFLNRPLIQAAIADKVRRVTEKYDVSVEALVRELAYMAKANMADYVRITPEGEPYVDLSEVTYEMMSAIKTVTVEDIKDGRGPDAREIRKVKFDLHDKQAAIDKLMRKHGAYAPVGGPTVNVQVNGNGTNLQIANGAVREDWTDAEAANYYARLLEE